MMHGLWVRGLRVRARKRLTVWRGHLQNRKDQKFRLAVGSFIEEYNNSVEIITCATPHPRARKIPG